jgi:hypothetical protein
MAVELTFQEFSQPNKKVKLTIRDKAVKDRGQKIKIKRR